MQCGGGKNFCLRWHSIRYHVHCEKNPPPPECDTSATYSKQTVPVIRKSKMRFGLIDLLFATACIAIGVAFGLSAVPWVSGGLRLVFALVCGLGVYLAL